MEFIPSCCTSEPQIADYALNAPFKRMSFLGKQVEDQLRACIPTTKIKLQHDMAGIAPMTLGWMMQSWEHITAVNTLKTMHNICYAKCFDDDAFRKRGAKM
eukprot:jgi/Ulvmu1/11574/UM079_0017.1